MVFDCLQRDSRYSNRLFQNYVILVLDFDSLLKLKFLLKIIDLGDQIEVNYKCSWIKKINRRIVDLKEGVKFSCS